MAQIMDIISGSNENLGPDIRVLERFIQMQSCKRRNKMIKLIAKALWYDPTPGLEGQIFGLFFGKSKWYVGELCSNEKWSMGKYDSLRKGWKDINNILVKGDSFCVSEGKTDYSNFQPLVVWTYKKMAVCYKIFDSPKTFYNDRMPILHSDEQYERNDNSIPLVILELTEFQN